MLFSYGSGQQRIDGNKTCRRIDGNFDCHGNAAVQRGAHLPMEHIQGFTRSHWMPPSVECLRRIAPAAAMVDDLIYGRPKPKVVRIFVRYDGYPTAPAHVCRWWIGWERHRGGRERLTPRISARIVLSAGVGRHCLEFSELSALDSFVLHSRHDDIKIWDPSIDRIRPCVISK
jgi:hypothetical protein